MGKGIHAQTRVSKGLHIYKGFAIIAFVRGVAQVVARMVRDHQVAGSSPVAPIFTFFVGFTLLQNIHEQFPCFAPAGSRSGFGTA